MIPTYIFALWIRGLLALAVLAGSICLGREWFKRSYIWDQQLQDWIFTPDLGWNVPTSFLAGAVLLAAIGLAGEQS